MQAAETFEAPVFAMTTLSLLLHNIWETMVDARPKGVVCETYGVTRDYHVSKVIFRRNSHEPRPHSTIGKFHDSHDPPTRFANWKRRVCLYNSAIL